MRLSLPISFPGTRKPRLRSSRCGSRQPAAVAARGGNRDALILKSLSSRKRAGCSGISTYYAPAVAWSVNSLVQRSCSMGVGEVEYAHIQGIACSKPGFILGFC